MERKRALNLYEAAREVGPYDERPVLPDKFDVQLHLSRNDRPQPFYLICDHDTLLTQLSGEAVVEFKGSTVQSYASGPGTFVYVPAGTPHRVVPVTAEAILVRHKALEAKLEGVAWYCQACGAEVWRDEWELAKELSQEGYWRACQAFNAEPARRVCPACSASHPVVDLTGINWPEVARSVRAEREAAE